MMKNRPILIIFLTIFILGIEGYFMRLSAQVDFTFTGVCIGSPTNFSGTAPGLTIVSWAWDYGDGIFDAGQTVTHTYLAPNILPGYPATLTVTDILGATSSVTKFISIQDLPIAFFSFNTPTCNSDSIYFHNLSSTTNGYLKRFVWDYGDGSLNDTVNWPFNPDVAHFFPSIGTFNVTLEVMNSDSCISQAPIPVTIIPSPIANFYFDGNCEDQVVQFTDASSPGGAGNIEYWNWNFGDAISGINNTSILPNPTHIFSTPGIFTVTLVVTNFNNCSDTMVKQVIIRQSPPVEFTYTHACLDELINFTADLSVMAPGSIGFWNWDFGDGVTNNDVQSTSHAFLFIGTYTVTLTVTDTSGCISSISHDIVINPLPVVLFSVSANTCAGSLVSFTDNSTTSVGYKVKWFWQFGDGTDTTVFFPGNPNISHLYSIGGTYPVTLTITSSDSCIGIGTQNIIIRPNPVANFDFGFTCLGTAVIFNDLSQSNGGGSIVDWNWNFGDPASGINNVSIIPNPSHLFTIAGSFNVSLIVTTNNGCSNTIVRTLIVTPAPPVEFTTQYRCQDLPVQFFPDTVIMNPATIASWLWDFGDGFTAVQQQQPSHVYILSGPYNVTLTVTDTAGCSNSITHTILIAPKPIVNFDYSSPTCFQSPTQFTDLSFVPSGYVVKWIWDFGDGTLPVTINFPGDPNILHTFTNYASFNVTLTVKTSDSCSNFITKVVNVTANPLANFTHQQATCLNTAVTFTDLSQNGAGNIIDWQWDFGDPASGINNFSTIQNPSHTYNSAGTFQVSLIVTSSTGCSDTDTIPITINPAPIADFTSVPGCVNDTTQFTSSTFVNTGATTTYFWQFGDGNTLTNIADPVHIYSQSGTFNVLLTITDTAGCTKTIGHFVTVVPAPVSLFTYITPACSNYPVQFNDMSTFTGGQIISWHWVFGDGSDTLITPLGNPNIAHTYNTFGTYNVVLTVATSMGCENVFSLPVTITTGPLAGFSYGTSCLSTPVDFTDATTTNGGTNIVSWLWNFGDLASGINNTSILQNPSHLFSSANNFSVNLLVINANGCIDTTIKIIAVNPTPGVDFGFGSPNCLGSSTSFFVDSTITNLPGVQTYDWDFGDGTPHSNFKNPNHIYSTIGIFNVILSITDTSGCENAHARPIEIHPLPTPLFSYNTACAGGVTNFIDESFTVNGEAIQTWHWHFNDPTSAGDTSNLPNPTWSYASSGTYTVVLTITSISGCAASISLPVQVYRPPTANFNYTAAPCNNGAVYFQDSSFAYQSTIAQWYWAFDPNHFSNLQNPVYVFFDTDSNYLVKLIVTDINGCTDTIIKIVYVPAPLDIAINFTETCYLQTTGFSVQLLAPGNDSLVGFAWNFGEPSSGFSNTSALPSPSHTYLTPGNYTVTLIVQDIHNCSKTVYQQVSVYTLPVPIFSYTQGNCDTTAKFDASSTGGGVGIKMWIWHYGDGTTDTIFAPASPDSSHYYINPGLYYVTLTVVNLNDCSATFFDSVLMKPCMVAIFSEVNTLGCQNQTITFAENSTSGIQLTKWFWDFGDGDSLIYSAQKPLVTHIYKTSGIFTVKLVISTQISGQTVSDSMLMEILISPSPIARYNIADVCLGLPAKFNNTSSGNGSQMSKYAWDFGVPGTTLDSSSLKNPSYNYKIATTYNVDLIVFNLIGCSDTVTHQLTIHPLPSAHFDLPASCAGDPTLFFDLSDTAIVKLQSWNWMFVDTTGIILGTDTAQNSSFTFPYSGKFYIILAVSDSNGCIDTLTKDLKTNPIPINDFSFTENYENLQGQLKLNNESIGAERYRWDFGNGTRSTEPNPSVTYKLDGVYPIELISWNAYNCSDTLIKNFKLLFKGLYIPNAFAPGSTFSSVQFFKPIGMNLASFEIDVYDSWGNLLWHSTKIDELGQPSESWDGTVHGNILPQDVYLWKARGVFKDGTVWKSKNVGENKGISDKPYGTVILIR